MADTPSDLADQAAEAIRTLNHITLGGTGLEYPGDLYSVIAGLGTMASRLPQLLGQLGEWLDGEHGAGRLGHDSGGNVAATVVSVRDELRIADGAAKALRMALNRAQNELSHLKAAE
jgi:hypothetical protein